jgi:S-adenosylmethionine:tRNA ribosyltransferase-isomerase
VLVDLFDYALPEGRIAQVPRPRGRSRLLVLSRADGSCFHRRFSGLPELLSGGDLLVRNDVRVSPARLLGEDEGGRPVELLLLRRTPREALCLSRPGRRTRAGSQLRFAENLLGRVEEALPDGRKRVAFCPALTDEMLHRIGHVPLPPYIKRPDRPEDSERYQTIFAKAPGAVAAPTAGLHFAENDFARLRERGVGIADLTLWIGAGTFKPVTGADSRSHRMEPEDVLIPSETAHRVRETKRGGGRIIAVGTTVTRALEAWARHGLEEFSTDLFIEPGFDFRTVDVLLTNFHLPRSTLLMLTCAFAGRENVLAAYREAIREGYLFYSYGDAMLIV